MQKKQAATEKERPSKNGTAPGTNMSYAEAVVNGAQTTLTLASLQKTLATLSTTVANLVAATEGRDKDVSSGYQTRKHGGKPRNAYGKFRGVKRQF